MAATSFLGGRVIVTTGDITSIAVDAIVNAANAALMGGGGGGKKAAKTTTSTVGSSLGERDTLPPFGRCMYTLLAECLYAVARQDVPDVTQATRR